MNDILVQISAFSLSTLVLRYGELPKRDPKIGFLAPCTQFPLSIKLPIFGPLESMLANEVAADMTFQAEFRENTSERAPQFDVGNVLFNILAPVFSNYFERQMEWLKLNVVSDPVQWTPRLNFSRVVRNAVVHHGVISISNPRNVPVSWKNLSYYGSQNGREIYPNDMNTGDFLALMIEIEEEMNALGAPVL